MANKEWTDIEIITELEHTIYPYVNETDLTIKGLKDFINRQKAEIERLKEYEDIRPTGCPNCHRGNFSNSKFCSHCGTQLQGKKKDVRTEAIKECLDKVKGQICCIPQHHFTLLEVYEVIRKTEKEMVGDKK